MNDDLISMAMSPEYFLGHRYDNGGSLFPYDGGTPDYSGPSRVDGIPEDWRSQGRISPGARVVDEEERTDYITEVLRRAMKPRPGESFDEYNDRLNSVRAEASAMISDARERGVKVSGSYRLNCISTALANYNDRDKVGTTGKYYDPYGLYQSIDVHYNKDLYDNPRKYGFERKFEFYPKALDQYFRDEIETGDGDEKREMNAAEEDYTNRMKGLQAADIRRGDIGSFLALKRGSKRPYLQSFHGVSVSGNDNGRVYSNYAPGEETDDRYEHDSKYWFNMTGDNDVSTYRYIGTPEEQKNRRLYYDAYSKGREIHDNVNENVKRHHKRMEKLLKSPDFWDVTKIEIPTYIKETRK